MKPHGQKPDTPADGKSGNAGPTAHESSEPILGRILAYKRLWILAAVTFAADQLTKTIVEARLPFGSYGARGIEVIPGFFNIVHVGNTGGAWSILSGRSTLLAIIGLCVLLAIFFWRRQLGLKDRFAQLCFGLFVGGSVGNIYDRLDLGYVVDFLDFHFGDYIYPTFNVADAAICIGVFGYVIWSLRQPPPPEESR